MEYPARYGGHIINGFIDSNIEGPNLQAWEDQADALFFLVRGYEDTCPGCQAVTTRNGSSSSILEVAVPASGSTTLDAAIRNALSGQISKHCANCSLSDLVDPNINHNSVTKIEAAPQILLIQLLLYHNTPVVLKPKKGPTHRLVKVPTRVDFQTILNHAIKPTWLSH